MHCPNCGTNDWKNVDEYRFKSLDNKGKPIGMSMCNECGFVSYPSKYQSKEEIIAHYRKEYRKPPTVMNMFTGQRKNHFHNAFLKEVISEWQKNNPSPEICEIGGAFGMSLNFFQQVLPQAKVSGTELTTTYKNVCFHEFGIKLEDDFDDTKKHDLIMSYKVLEHQLDPHLELLRYAKALKTDGYLYISVPTWFGPMVNFGLEGFDLDYYYEPNHINVWTKELFEHLLRRSGFKIVKEDRTMYGDTYLCKLQTEPIKEPVYKEDTSKIIDSLKRIKEAFLLFVDQKYDQAIKVWPNFPQAQISNVEMKRKLLTELGWDKFRQEVLGPAVLACPETVEVLIMCTDFALRAKQYDKAIEIAMKCLELKPNNPASLFQAATAFEQSAVMSKVEKEKIAFLIKAKEAYFHLMNVSEQNKHDCITRIYHLNAHIPH